MPLASPPRDGRTRIVIADADRDFSEALRASVEIHDAFEVVGIAKDGREAIRLTETLQPSLVLMDLSIVGMESETTKTVHKLSENAAVVLMIDDEAPDLHTVELPVAGFVRKSSDVDSLIDVVIAFADFNAGPP